MASSFKPLSQADLYFSSASTNIDNVSRQLKQSSSTQSVSARLHSIKEDSAYVRSSAQNLKLPVVSNERCGSWYVPPDLKAGSAYFKSTDGHAGSWSFSLRRLNLHLLPLIGRHNGCIVVDSTRRGKYMPDALSKTVPIWCAVMNRLLFPDISQSHSLLVHSRLVSSSEHSQIATCIDSFTAKAKELNLDLEPLRMSTKKPMIPSWLSRSLDGPPIAPSLQTDFNVVYCCMASTHQDSSRIESITGYVQGAGDDNESWSRGLSPEIFWEHSTKLLNAPEGDLPSLIEALTTQPNRQADQMGGICTLWPYSQLKVGRLSSCIPAPGSAMASIVCAPTVDPVTINSLGKNLLHLRCRDGKIGARDLREELPKILSFIRALAPGEEILVCCQTGKDLAIGVALAIICTFGDNNGHICNATSELTIDKLVIRRKLAGVMVAMPTASPSRATLNAVNSYLMKEP